MTVNKVTDQQKDAVALIYRNKSKTILEMAVCMGVSERTIRRILVEKGEITQKAIPASVKDKVMLVLRAWKINPAGLQKFLEVLEQRKYLQCDEKSTVINPPRSASIADVVIRMSYLPEEQYQEMLAKIIHTREAIKYNISVQAAMLKLEQQTINAVKNQYESHEPK